MFLMRSYCLNLNIVENLLSPEIKPDLQFLPWLGSCFYNGILVSVTRKTNFITCSVFLCILKGFPPLVLFEHHFLSPLSCFYAQHICQDRLCVQSKCKDQFSSLASTYLVGVVLRLRYMINLKRFRNISYHWIIP